MNNIYDEILIAAHSVWNRRWLALGMAWAICAVGWLVVAIIPNSYESRARIFVQMQSILPGKMGITPMEQQKDVDRVRQTLTSAVNLEKVVRGTDLSLSVASPRDMAGKVEMLRTNIKVVAQQDNLFEITAISSDSGMSDAANAKMATAVVQKLIDIFVEENLAGDRAETSQTLKFLDSQLAERERQLQEAEQKRMEFEEQYLGLLPGTGSMSERMDAARQELNQIESQLVAAQSASAAMNGQLAATPATIATPGVGGGGAYSSTQAELASARARGWTDNHPDVIALKRQLANLKSMGSGGSGSGGGTPNPAYISIRSMQAEKQATVSALAARKAQLTADMQRLAEKQANEPGVAAEQAQLSRNYDVLKAQYDKLFADREDIRLRGDVQTETDAVQFRIIDPPSSPRTPAAPNRPLLLLAVLVVGIGGGVGAAFAKGQLRTTYPTATRLERLTGLPVLGAVTETLTSAHRELRHKKLRLFAGASGALVAVCLLLVAVEFIQRGLVA
ncbi:XrtA system polysaccharide chain length determinant [Rhizorhapis suberifaciens]|uniref:Polysaccharide chain length determinant protein (PEP-CTERM system associated) n=1 Tax=Rhizorhapis suberifaciens TaxID=13656 RepID=A0A840HX16_9SPHN|nr:XrtA system polysaccharide chain length determinant [Rhizorhapis suberifaciens]MBB4642109.1 polysaccharide chain length determinant protein (PEP-CTERM system associated) [Rhizorhapis suberifaciens]